MAVETEPTIRAALDAALRKVRLPETRWASVDEYDPITEQTQVVVDGDSVATSATNATGTGLAPGQRVFVLHSPPSGAHVIGYRSAPPITYTPELQNVDVGDGTVYGEYLFGEGGMIDFAVYFSLGAGSSVSGEIGVGLPMPGSTITTLLDIWLISARATLNGVDRYAGLGVYSPADAEFVSAFGSDGGGLWSTSVPGVWASGDVLRVSGRYPRRLPVEDSEDF